MMEEDGTEVNISLFHISAVQGSSNYSGGGRRGILLHPV